MVHAVSEQNLRNALSERELDTLSSHIYFSSFALSSRAPANYKFGTCTDMFTVHRLYFIINGIARESAGWSAHERHLHARARARAA